jgi:hypothetical protein
VIGVLYLKFFAQVAATVLSAIAAAMQAGPLSATAWVNVVVIGFGAIGVLGAGELPSGVWAHTKPIVAALSAAVVVIETSLAGGFTAATIVQAVIAAFGALGILALPGPVLTSTAMKSGLLLKAPRRGKHEEIV